MLYTVVAYQLLWHCSIALRKRTRNISGSSATEEGQHNASGPRCGSPVASLLAGLILHFQVLRPRYWHGPALLSATLRAVSGICGCRPGAKRPGLNCVDFLFLFLGLRFDHDVWADSFL